MLWSKVSEVREVKSDKNTFIADSQYMSSTTVDNVFGQIVQNTSLISDRIDGCGSPYDNLVVRLLMDRQYNRYSVIDRLWLQHNTIELQ